MQLTTSSATVSLDLEHGARVSSLAVHGRELLVAGEDAPDSTFGRGSFPMAPWAGRVRDGRFEFGGQIHQLPIDAAPHAIHGTTHSVPWEPLGTTGARIELGGPWPFGGTVEQHFELGDDRFRMIMTITAGDAAMPAMLGWHPWFRRSIEEGRPEAQLEFDAAFMYELDEVAIPTGSLVSPPAGPWDNCFTAVDQPIRIVWPDQLTIALTSSCRDWVIYTEPVTAFCVEPQTSAPDSFNRRPDVLAQGQSLSAWYEIAWS